VVPHSVFVCSFIIRDFGPVANSRGQDENGGRAGFPGATRAFRSLPFRDGFRERNCETDFCHEPVHSGLGLIWFGFDVQSKVLAQIGLFTSSRVKIDKLAGGCGKSQRVMKIQRKNPHLARPLSTGHLG